jgi:tRNA1(Val) A37 N6-methylase TrmN6
VQKPPNSYQRRLFANDAVRGFALIDLCRKKFDVALMNPPFGAGSTQTKAKLESVYPRTKNDVYAAFVERGLQLLHQRGQLGAITSRTVFSCLHFRSGGKRLELLRESRREGKFKIDNCRNQVKA